MLSMDEQREMREDGADRHRRDHFRAVHAAAVRVLTFDEYLRFLNQVHRLFAQMEPLRRITRAEQNRL